MKRTKIDKKRPGLAHFLKKKKNECIVVLVKMFPKRDVMTPWHQNSQRRSVGLAEKDPDGKAAAKTKYFILNSH